MSDFDQRQAANALSGVRPQPGLIATSLRLRLSQELSADFITACLVLRRKITGKLLPRSSAIVPSQTIKTLSRS
jgi:hypothetical protein